MVSSQGRETRKETTIAISRELKSLLDEYGRKNESYDELIRDLLMFALERGWRKK